MLNKTTQLKLSRYNHLLNINGMHILFNARTLAIAGMEAEDAAKIQNMMDNSAAIDADPIFRDDLAKAGYLIDVNRNEKEEISQQLWKARLSKEYCSVTIAPTMGCNFNCGYCFESEDIRSNYSKMDEATQDQLVIFLNNHFEKFKTKELKFCWFGGEPLLATSVIERVSEKILAICAAKEIKYSADIITNGYRLNKETAQLLKRCQISAAQITIDGPSMIHDNRRVLKGNKGTLKRILNNVGIASEYINIKLRVNLDKQNFPYVEEMLREMEDKFDKNKVFIYAAAVYSDSNKHMESVYFSRKEFSRANFDFQQTCESKKYQATNPLNVITNACGGDHAYSYMFGPKGEIYQCWEDFGDEKYVVGNIFQAEKFNQLYVNSYLEFDPTKHSKCTDCTVMPLCMGGCPKRRLQHDGVPQCGVYKFNLEQYISSYIKMTIIEKEGM